MRTMTRTTMIAMMIRTTGDMQLLRAGRPTAGARSHGVYQYPSRAPVGTPLPAMATVGRYLTDAVAIAPGHRAPYPRDGGRGVLKGRRLGESRRRRERSRVSRCDPGCAAAADCRGRI